MTNAIAPSYIDTEQLRVAATVAFLAGPGSTAVIGQVLQPNGGVTRTRA